MAKLAFVNDTFIEEEKAALHFKDLSFQRGYGVFDFCRLAGNKPLFLDDHLTRFYSSAEGLHLPMPFSLPEIKDIIQELVKRNYLPGTGIRLHLTGGYSADGFIPAKPNFIISQHPIAAPGSEQLEKGIKLLSYPHQRQLYHIKTIDYLMAIWLQPLLKEKGFNDVLYHQDGVITECPRSNFFMVTSDNALVTPAANILAGVTRKRLLEIADKCIRVEERPIHINEIKAAKEAFITSTTKQILSVAQIDEIILPERNITLDLRHLFQLYYEC
ncbi:MAG TPA: aminotransferase class IV [Flavisolibacter sp.]|nr:aminotransferase class IV [Flavisolibacter sp.]